MKMSHYDYFIFKYLIMFVLNQAKYRVDMLSLCYPASVRPHEPSVIFNKAVFQHTGHFSGHEHRQLASVCD